MAPTLPFPTTEQSSKKKRKRTLDEDDRTTETQQAGGAPPRPKPQKTASISTLMSGMDIDSPPKAGGGENKTLKRKKSHRRDDSLASIMEVDASVEKKPVEEETHGRQKRLRKEPSVVEPPIVPLPPPSKPKNVAPVPDDHDTSMNVEKAEKAEKKKKKKGKEAATNGQDEAVAESSSVPSTLTPLQAQMKEKLQGSLFR